MISSLISKCCWLVLVLFRLGHGAVLLLQAEEAIKFATGKEAQDGYIGGFLGMELILTSMRLTGANEIMLGLAAFSMGDSKQCYSLLMLSLLTSAVVIQKESVLLKLSAGDTLTAEHVDAIELGGLFLLALVLVNLVGFLTCGGKNNSKLTRSPSVIASFALKLTTIVEFALCTLAAVDILKFDKASIQGFDPATAYTAAGRGMISLLAVYGAMTACSLALFIVILKPTHVACGLAFLLNLLKLGVYLASKLQYEKDPSPSAMTKGFIEFADGGMMFHGAFASLLAIALLSSMMTPGKPKEKTE